MADSSPSPPRNTVGVRPIEKNGQQLLDCIDRGGMAAVVSGDEIMYVLARNQSYHCLIHKIDAEEGRRKSFVRDEHSRAMLKNLDSAADSLFELIYEPEMDLMGVMVAAERGICDYLDSTGQLKTEPIDFMAPYEQTGQTAEAPADKDI